MNRQTPRYQLVALAWFLLLPSINLPAQGTRYTVGPLTVTIPAGWNAKTNFPGERERFYSPGSTWTKSVAVGFSSSESTDDVLTKHNTIIKNLSGVIAPGTSPESGTIGQFVWTRIVIQPAGTTPRTLILYSLKVGSTYVGIDIDSSSDDLLASGLPPIEAMIRAATINAAAGSSSSASGAPAATAPGSGGARSHIVAPSQPPRTPADAVSAIPAQMPTGPATLSEYVYSIPPGWTSKPDSRFTSILSPVSSTGEQCQITMFPLQPASDDLMKDALGGFQQAFAGWEPRSQTSYGPLEPSLIRGTAGAGWSYVIVKQGIGRRGPYESLMGSVMVAKLNNALALILTISKDPLVSTCFGQNLTDAWPDFFYSLGFKSWVVPPSQAAAMKQALVGTWTAATATAADQFTFTANGRYGGASAAQHYNLAANDTVVATTQAFFGDGAYSLQGNTITFAPDDRNRPRNSGRFRLEQESKDGGRSWKPILYLLRISSVDGKEYEVRYQRTGN